MERHLLFRHLENNHNEFESLPIENKIHKAIQTVVLNYFYMSFFVVHLFCNSTSKIENIQNTLLLTFLFQYLQICTRKKDLSCFHFFFHNKNLYILPPPPPLFTPPQFPKLQLHLGFLPLKSKCEAAHGDDGLRWMYYAQ